MTYQPPDDRDEVARYHISDEEGASEGVVTAVSEATGLSAALPLENAADSDLVLDPLASVIDPDALDRLFDDGVLGRVSFTYHGHSVTVDSTGLVTVAPEATSAERPTRFPAPATTYRPG